MKLNPFNRNRDTQSPTETTDYYSNAGSEGSSSIDWRRAIPRVAAVILVIGLLVFGAMALFGGSDEKKPTVEKKSTTAQQEQKARAEKRQASNPATQPPSPNPSTSTPSSPAAPSSNTRQLADSGPGEVAALFIATTIGGALTYHVALRRQLSS